MPVRVMIRRSVKTYCVGEPAQQRPEEPPDEEDHDHDHHDPGEPVAEGVVRRLADDEPADDDRAPGAPGRDDHRLPVRPHLEVDALALGQKLRGIAHGAHPSTPSPTPVRDHPRSASAAPDDGWLAEVGHVSGGDGVRLPSARLHHEPAVGVDVDGASRRAGPGDGSSTRTSLPRVDAGCAVVRRQPRAAPRLEPPSDQATSRRRGARSTPASSVCRSVRSAPASAARSRSAPAARRRGS